MTRLIIALSAILMLAATASAATQTMRLDYYHTGDASSEVFSVDRIVIEPLPWPGDLKQAIDTSNLGKYLFEVRDAKTKQVLYSRGFRRSTASGKPRMKRNRLSARFRNRCASLLRRRPSASS